MNKEIKPLNLIITPEQLQLAVTLNGQGLTELFDKINEIIERLNTLK